MNEKYKNHFENNTINNKIDNYFIVIFKKIKNMLIRIDGIMIGIDIMDIMVIISIDFDIVEKKWLFIINKIFNIK